MKEACWIWKGVKSEFSGNNDRMIFTIQVNHFIFQINFIIQILI